jgi:hypothetical protein
MGQHIASVSSGSFGTTGAGRFDVETGLVQKQPVRNASGIGQLMPPPGLEDGKLDHLALQLKEICRSATLNLSYRIGELIIRELYDNHIELWGQQGTRHISYRLLAARGDLPLSPSALCKSVAVYALSERLGGTARWRHLGVSHVQEVLSVEASEQERLLRLAETERWTVARLRSEVSAFRPGRRGRGEASFRKSVDALRACISKHQATLASIDTIENVDHDVADLFCEAVTSLKLQVHELEHALDRYKERQRAKGGARAPSRYSLATSAETIGDSFAKRE